MLLDVDLVASSSCVVCSPFGWQWQLSMTGGQMSEHVCGILRNLLKRMKNTEKVSADG